MHSFPHFPEIRPPAKFWLCSGVVSFSLWNMNITRNKNHAKVLTSRNAFGNDCTYLL